MTSNLQRRRPLRCGCDRQRAGSDGSLQGTVARLGSDGTGASRGRYRFANNTIIVRSAELPVRALLAERGSRFRGAMNNVFGSHAGPAAMVRQEHGTAPVLKGGGNWLPMDANNAPAAWKAIRGKIPDSGTPPRAITGRPWAVRCPAPEGCRPSRRSLREAARRCTGWRRLTASGRHRASGSSARIRRRWKNRQPVRPEPNDQPPSSDDTNAPRDVPAPKRCPREGHDDDGDDAR